MSQQTLTVDEAATLIQSLDTTLAVIVNQGPHATQLKHQFVDRVIAESETDIVTNLTPHTSYDYIPNWDLRGQADNLDVIAIKVV